MSNRISLATAGIVATFFVFGCGSSQSDHEVKPLTERPPVTSPFKALKTPEEKIKYIQNSGAPESEKAAAIEKIKAGQL